MVKFIGNPVINWVADRRIIVEVVLTAITLSCFFLYHSTVISGLPLMLTMLTLGGFYFIGALFFVIESSDIVTIISSKILGIASAVSTVGILFTLLQFEGAKNQLTIGMISLLPAVLVVGVSYLRNQSELLLVLVVRGLAVLSAGLYFFQLTIL